MQYTFFIKPLKEKDPQEELRWSLKAQVMEGTPKGA
jgi:hypothetical protein